MKLLPLAYLNTYGPNSFRVAFTLKTGEVLEKIFKIPTNGKPSVTLRNAMSWRDGKFFALISAGLIDTHVKYHPFRKKSKRNKSGRVGVFYQHHVRRRINPNGRPTIVTEHCWIATWTMFYIKNGVIIRKKHTKRFSIPKLGHDEAKAAAIAHREEMEIEMSKRINVSRKLRWREQCRKAKKRK